MNRDQRSELWLSVNKFMLRRLQRACYQWKCLTYLYYLFISWTRAGRPPTNNRKIHVIVLCVHVTAEGEQKQFEGIPTYQQVIINCFSGTIGCCFVLVLCLGLHIYHSTIHCPFHDAGCYHELVIECCYNRRWGLLLITENVFISYSTFCTESKNFI